MWGLTHFIAQAGPAVSQALAPESPYYERADFWISTALGAGGIFFSILAFFEARNASVAARAAGKTVKIQTIVIELSEISQRLDGIDLNLDYGYARELLQDAARRLRRQLAAIQDDEDVHNVVVELFQLLDAAKSALATVRPASTGSTNAAPPSPLASVFYAMESHFGAVNAKLAELTGLLEKRTIDPA